MVEEHSKNWKDLCQSIILAEDPEKMLNLVQQLNRLLESKEAAGRNFGMDRATQASEEHHAND
jgi:hypothetical protein